jgi:hypothetical protein
MNEFPWHRSKHRLVLRNFDSDSCGAGTVTRPLVFHHGWGVEFQQDKEFCLLHDAKLSTTLTSFCK